MAVSTALAAGTNRAPNVDDENLMVNGAARSFNAGEKLLADISATRDATAASAVEAWSMRCLLTLPPPTSDTEAAVHCVCTFLRGWYCHLCPGVIEELDGKCSRPNVRSDSDESDAGQIRFRKRAGRSEDEHDTAPPLNADCGCCAPTDFTTDEATLLERPHVSKLVYKTLTEREHADRDDDVDYDSVLQDALRR